MVILIIIDFSKELAITLISLYWQKKPISLPYRL